MHFIHHKVHGGNRIKHLDSKLAMQKQCTGLYLKIISIC